MIINVKSADLAQKLKDTWHTVHRDPSIHRRLALLPPSAGIDLIINEIIKRVLPEFSSEPILNKAPDGSFVVPDGGALSNQNFCITLLGCMLLWNDGEPISFSQADFNAITGFILLEGRDEHGNFMLGLKKKEEKNEPLQ